VCVCGVCVCGCVCGCVCVGVCVCGVCVCVCVSYYAMGSGLIPDNKNVSAGEVCLAEECLANSFFVWLAKRTNLCRPIHNLKSCQGSGTLSPNSYRAGMGLISGQSP